VKSLFQPALRIIPKLRFWWRQEKVTQDQFTGRSALPGAGFAMALHLVSLQVRMRGLKEK